MNVKKTEAVKTISKAVTHRDDRNLQKSAVSAS